MGEAARLGAQIADRWLLFEAGRHFPLPLDQSEDRGYRGGSTAYRDQRAIGKKNPEEFERGLSDRTNLCSGWLSATADFCRSQKEMLKIPEPYVGKWRITHMDQWDQDFVDLVTIGHVTIRKDGTGEFQFGAVQGEMDCRIENTGAGPVLGFTWDGSDECDPASGRGWVKLSGKQMEGHLFFHLGDDSAFTVKKMR